MTVLGALLGLAALVIFLVGGLCLWRDRRHPPLSPSLRRDHHRASRAYARGEVIKRS